MGKAEATKFRVLAARANYLAQDRVDVQYAAKEICREMARPTEIGWRKLKRLARYLLDYPRAILEFKKTKTEFGKDVLEVYSDSDWAGCIRTRRSTSGGVVMLNGTLVKSWSSTQATTAQSSGEAEFYAVVRAAAEGLGIKAIMEDMGYEVEVRVHVDSSSAKSMASRTGLGKVRHMEVKFLWVQEAVRTRRVQLKKILGNRNSLPCKRQNYLHLHSTAGSYPAKRQNHLHIHCAAGAYPAIGKTTYIYTAQQEPTLQKGKKKMYIYIYI